MKNKILILTFLLILSYASKGQDSKHDITGSWILIKRNYNSGEDLPSKLVLKESYYRFDFKDYGKVFKSFSPSDNGFDFAYSISGRNIKIGFVNYYLELLTKDSLILIEEGNDGFEGKAIKYTFLSEQVYQDNIPLTSDMVIVSANDTVYIENQKIRANFENTEPFDTYISKKIDYPIEGNVFFMATFIIDSNGEIDSIKIHKGINNTFDNKFLKAIKKSEGFWIPAKFHNKNVNVLRQFIIRSIPVIATSNSVTASNNTEDYLNYVNGIIFTLQGEYIQALARINRYLETEPNDTDAIYQRGYCYYKTNDFKNASLDWEKIKNIKTYKSNALIKQLCKN